MADLTVKRIEMIPVEVPLREIPARNMVREIPHWTLFEIWKVTLACGIVGVGETMRYYTWGVSGQEDADRLMERNAAEMMWDDSLGAGLQMALFDAVARANDVPVHRLLGHKVRDRAFVSWWDIDMPVEDWIAECRDAMSAGYTDFKTKARPWFCVRRQVAELCATLPGHFQLDMDFNGMLIDVGHATRLLVELERHANVAMFETPMPQHDVAGNKHIRRATRVPIAHHFGNPPIMTALQEDVCDGFVVSGGVGRVHQSGIIAATANKPFFLQIVGTGLAAAMSMHHAAVLSHARWPAVSCNTLYKHELIAEPFVVENGTVAIPEAPGLIDVDWDAIERHRLDKTPDKPYPHPGLLLAIRFPTGTTVYYAHCQQYWDDFENGRLPSFAPGVHLEHVPDDGSKEWSELQERARQGGVHVGGSAI
ncbi:MAG: mandelate racemase/muconate lactonizing enzyme family protein [Phycisphaerae bacterium]|nr:mandelate racemase/muconate lactonizing enzyme family protein [Phycisphaerae bacterium]